MLLVSLYSLKQAGVSTTKRKYLQLSNYTDNAPGEYSDVLQKPDLLREKRRGTNYEHCEQRGIRLPWMFTTDSCGFP